MEEKEKMKNCLRLFLNKGQGTADLKGKEHTNKPSGALRTCIKPRPANEEGPLDLSEGGWHQWVVNLAHQVLV